MNERGYTYCERKGKSCKGPERTGGPYNVSIPVQCPPGATKRALFHIHPSGNLNPSKADLRQSAKHGLPVCIGNTSGSEVRCYRPKGPETKRG